MGKTIRITVEFKVEVKVPLSGASADELALSIGRVRDEMGRELMKLSIEGIQEAIVERSSLPRRAGPSRSDVGPALTRRAARHGAWQKPDKRRCACTSFTKQGFRRGRRSIRTHLGEVNFRVRNVRCERCGQRYSPVLRFLDLRERKRRLSSLEKIVAEVVSLETYGKSEDLVEKATGERVPDATMPAGPNRIGERTLRARLDCRHRLGRAPAREIQAHEDGHVGRDGREDARRREGRAAHRDRPGRPKQTLSYGRIFRRAVGEDRPRDQGAPEGPRPGDAFRP